MGVVGSLPHAPPSPRFWASLRCSGGAWGDGRGMVEMSQLGAAAALQCCSRSARVLHPPPG